VAIFWLDFICYLFPQLAGHLEQRCGELLRLPCAKLDRVMVRAIKRSHADRPLFDPDADIPVKQMENGSVENFDKAHLIYANASSWTGVSG